MSTNAQISGTSKVAAVSHHVVDEDSAGQRIDNFLLKILKGVPKSHIYRILRSGEVRVNKGRIDASYRLVLGDQVRLPPVRREEKSPLTPTQLAERQSQRYDFSILFEDECILVIDKPAGVAVHGGSGISLGVIEALRAQRPQAKFLELVHRLDRDTSGVLLLAKKRSALTHLHAQIRNESGDDLVDKVYSTLVLGKVSQQRFHAKQPLLKYLLADGERRVRVDKAGQFSHTIFDVVARYTDGHEAYTLLDATLKTGRTHQIRVHSSQAGYPIVGDDKYGHFEHNKWVARSLQAGGLGFKRMFLHARRLTFVHPRTEATMSINAPLPAECQQLLQVLQAGSINK